MNVSLCVELTMFVKIICYYDDACFASINASSGIYEEYY